MIGTGIHHLLQLSWWLPVGGSQQLESSKRVWEITIVWHLSSSAVQWNAVPEKAKGVDEKKTYSTSAAAECSIRQTMPAVVAVVAALTQEISSAENKHTS